MRFGGRHGGDVTTWFCGWIGCGWLFGFHYGLSLRCKFFSAWIGWLAGLRLPCNLFSARVGLLAGLRLPCNLFSACIGWSSALLLAPFGEFAAV